MQACALPVWKKNPYPPLILLTFFSLCYGKLQCCFQCSQKIIDAFILDIYSCIDFLLRLCKNDHLLPDSQWTLDSPGEKTLSHQV